MRVYIEGFFVCLFLIGKASSEFKSNGKTVFRKQKIDHLRASRRWGIIKILVIDEKKNRFF